jgi:hypothetical protein
LVINWGAELKNRRRRLAEEPHWVPNSVEQKIFACAFLEPFRIGPPFSPILRVVSTLDLDIRDKTPVMFDMYSGMAPRTHDP